MDHRDAESAGVAPAGTVFDIDTFAVHDGPGIRMAVYLKGCPLACAWCHSPDSQQSLPEVILMRDRCTLCGECVSACIYDRHEVREGAHVFERNDCVVCGDCVRNCPAGALAVRGRSMSAAEVVARAERMIPFFRYSGGGVTLTGGEATGQADFAFAILDGCRRLGIHTAIETCGACAPDTLARLCSVTDLVLYDIKLVDEDAHRRWTGVGNARILENLLHLTADRVQVRIPLIPEVTDTDENLSGIFAYVRGCGLRRVAVLPFNPSSVARYEWLGRTCTISGEPQSPGRLSEITRMGRNAGLDIEVC